MSIINEKYFKQYSPIPLNYDITELKNYINVAEKVWIKKTIGEDLYNEILEQVENNQVSETNAALLVDGGLWQYLSFATCLEGLAFIYADFSAAGITKAKTDFSESVTLKELTFIESNLRRQVEVLKDEVIKWLNERAEYFPLYHPTDCGCGCNACGTIGKLNKPNPMFGIYSTRRKCTNLK